MIVIIGGSGFYDFMDDASSTVLQTPFGEVQYDAGKIGGQSVAFIPRHGKGHTLPPSSINYRANIFAAHILKAEAILTTNAVGSMQSTLGPGTLAIPTQILDFTRGRVSTFFDGSEFAVTTNSGNHLSGVVHTDVSQPYHETVRQQLIQAAKSLDLEFHDGGVMAVYNGPRYETAAEVQAAKLLGADFAGMTSAPEAFLARELELPYATIAVITNYAAGLQSQVSHQEVEEIFGQKIETIKSLFRSVITTRN